jgi:hypothetical protein
MWQASRDRIDATTRPATSDYYQPFTPIFGFEFKAAVPKQ